VDKRYSGDVIRQIRIHVGDPEIDQRPLPEQLDLDLFYLGMAKERVNGQRNARGQARLSDTWNWLFPLNVLQDWFCGITGALWNTHYEALGIQQDAPQGDIKSAYRRAARTWHPDVCDDENANEMFLRVQAAYEMLKDPLMRKRYDMGLALTAKLDQCEEDVPNRRGELEAASWQGREAWVPPVRCGRLEVTVSDCIVGVNHVSEIHSWKDIMDFRDRVLVTHWDRDTKKVVEEWV
jgi:DnaJ-domain-containing protein 1